MIPEFKPQDYITNGHDLFQIIDENSTEWIVEDCSWPCDQVVPLLKIAKAQPLDAWRRVLQPVAHV